MLERQKSFTERTKDFFGSIGDAAKNALDSIATYLHDHPNAFRISAAIAATVAGAFTGGAGAIAIGVGAAAIEAAIEKACNARVEGIKEELAKKGEGNKNNNLKDGQNSQQNEISPEDLNRTKELAENLKNAIGDKHEPWIKDIIEHHNHEIGSDKNNHHFADLAHNHNHAHASENANNHPSAGAGDGAETNKKHHFTDLVADNHHGDGGGAGVGVGAGENHHHHHAADYLAHKNHDEKHTH